MKIKKSILFALMIGALINFTSCSDDSEEPDNTDTEAPKDDEPKDEENKETEEEELTEEEKIELKRVELLEKIITNFDSITSNKWQYVDYEASEAMITASKTEDGADALTIITTRESAKNFNLIISFGKDELDVNANTSGLNEDEIFTELLKYQTVLMPFMEGADYLVFGEIIMLGDLRKSVASPFAYDDIHVDDIVDDEGLITFSIAMNDYASLEYEDLVLAQNKLVKGNEDKMYFNEDGTLTVETTDKKYGVSKVIYKLVE